jgi:RNA polymerase sigma-70 factor (ECF subfamily)
MVNGQLKIPVVVRVQADLRIVDPDDVLQSAFQSFFLRHARGQFDPTGWESLWGILALLTVRKCCRKHRHFHAQARDVRREAGAPAGGAESSAEWDMIANEPTPQAAAELSETVERLLSGLKPGDREIVVLSLQGCAVVNVSVQVGCSERKVQRVLERVRTWLERASEADREGA